MRHLVSFLSCFSLLATAACTDLGTVEPVIAPAGDPHVLNGEESWEAAAVAIMPRDQSSICSGALITQRVVLTAAHCLYSGHAVTDLEVYVGSHVANDAVKIAVIDGAHAPGYEHGLAFPDYGDDVALLLLAQPANAPYTYGVWSPAETWIKIIGFGRDNDGLVGRRLEGWAQLHTEDTRGFYWYEPSEALQQLGQGGDSGGPCLGRVNGSYYIVGTHTGRIQDDSGKTWGIMTLAGYKGQWINDWLSYWGQI